MQARVVGAAVLALAAAPAWAAAPPSPPDPARVQALVRQLSAANFEARENAEAALRRGGKAVVPQLQQELARARSPETRRRLESALAALTLAERLAKASALDEERVRALVRDLGDDRFAVRERATRQLRGAGRPVVPLLRREMERAPDAEVRVRLQTILRDILGGK
jgi:hypothetical protein